MDREVYQAGALDDDAAAADLLQAYEARVAALERLVSEQALELGVSACTTATKKRTSISDHRPRGLSITENAG